MKIGFIAPYHELAQIAEGVRKNADVELIVKEATYTQAVEEARKMEELGVEAIISRGATCAYIERYSQLPVINCDYGVSDLLYALREAKKFGRRIGVVTYTPHDWMKHIFDDLFQMDIIFLDGYQDEAENRELVERLKRQRIEVIVGGSISVKLAEKLDMHGILVHTHPETIVRSVEDSVRVVNAVRKERGELEKIKQIISVVPDAIILTDNEGNVMLMNSSAHALIRRHTKNQKITSVYQIFADTDFKKGIREGGVRLGEIKHMGDIPLLFNQSPIKINNERQNMVLMLQEVSKIQKLENRIRAQLHTKGMSAKYSIKYFIGESSLARECKEKAIRYASLDSTVLLLGESGTGKEILAQSIHNASIRKNGPFVAINCSAIANNLLESELFGYEDGAFTGAKRGGKSGLFELAHQGTIFLDEIGDISKEFQSTLLRVIQEKEVRRIGSDRVVPIDVRILAATNSNLPAAVRAGDFRLDLYYRLCVLEIRVPSLRKRKEDIPLLVRYFCRNIEVEDVLFNDSVLSKMQEYDWPGNVRELRNFVEKACLLAPDISVSSLWDEYIITNSGLYAPAEPSAGNENCLSIQKGTLEQMESQLIQKMYEDCGRNKTILAERLNISRVTVWNKLNKNNKADTNLYDCKE